MSAIYEEEVAKHTSSHRSSDYSKPVHTIWTDPDVSWNDKSFESTSNKVDFYKYFRRLIPCVSIARNLRLYSGHLFLLLDSGRQIFPGQQEVQYVRQLAIRVEWLLLQSLAHEQQVRRLRQYDEPVEPPSSRLRHELLNSIAVKLPFPLQIPIPFQLYLAL